MKKSSKVVGELVVGGLLIEIIGYALLQNASPWQDNPIYQYWPAFFQLLGLALVIIGVWVSIEANMTKRFNE